MSETEDYDKSATPTAHKTSHQDGGADEINVDALLGSLSEAQISTWDLVAGKPTAFTPAAHKTSHQDAGADELSVEGLAGELTAEQKSAWAKVSGKPTTFAPEPHKTSHQAGGADEIARPSGLLEIDADDNLQPVTAAAWDEHYELDALDDIMPRAIFFDYDTLGDVMPAAG